ncbi:MAG: DUF4886 domain-containing protein [Pseudomonadota bacterium]
MQRIGLVAAVLMTVAAGAHASERTTAEPPTEPPSLSVLFFGNSHLIAHNVPRRVGLRLQKHVAGRRSVLTRRIGFNGARLSQFIDRPSVKAVLAERRWDVIVLQEATASFLTPALRLQFHRALRWFRRSASASTRIVLFQTWAWQDHHRYFRKDLVGGPRDQNSFWRLIDAEYRSVEADDRLAIAPVGKCWLDAARVRRLFSRDGNHATLAGSDYAARIIADTIASPTRVRC